jgi:hypothetical protein
MWLRTGPSGLMGEPASAVFGRLLLHWSFFLSQRGLPITLNNAAEEITRLIITVPPRSLKGLEEQAKYMARFTDLVAARNVATVLTSEEPRKSLLLGRKVAKMYPGVQRLV